MSQGKTVSIRWNPDSVVVGIRPDKCWFQKIDAVFNLTDLHDLTDEFAGIKNYKAYKIWAALEEVDVIEITGCWCYLFFGEKKLTIIIRRTGAYKDILTKLLAQFPVLQPTASNRYRKGE